MRKKELIDLCKSVGVMLLDSGDELMIDAPTGYVLGGCGSHSWTMRPRHDGWKREEAYEELSNCIGHGVEKCEDPECDSCIHEPMTFEEIQQLYRGERLA